MTTLDQPADQATQDPPVLAAPCTLEAVTVTVCPVTVSDHPTTALPIWVDQALAHRLLPPDVGEATSRLLAEFDGRIDGEKVIFVVIGAHRDLLDCPLPTRLELVERSARQRLLAFTREAAGLADSPS